MLTYTLEKEKGSSLYAALYTHIREDIRSGKLPAGTRLPSKRSLSANLGVSVVTVETAYAQLIAEGYAYARERSGVYVCAIGEVGRSLPVSPPAAPALPEEGETLLDLSGGRGADLPFPLSVWAKTMREVISARGESLLHRVDYRGVGELRQAIADHLYRFRGMQVSSDQIIIGAGNEHLYGLLVQLLGRQSVYAVEDPCYSKIRRVYEANGVRLCHIPLDHEGMEADALRQSGAQIAHISPAHHYPTGIVMPIRRRLQLLSWAQEGQGRWLIEDDYDSELRHRGKPVPSLFSLDRGQKVIYMSSFSQTIAPSLRISYVCLPLPLLTLWQEKLGFYSCAVPAFEQYTLAAFISSGSYEKHLNRLKKRFRDKRTCILDLLRRSPLQGSCTLEEESAGTHFLLNLSAPVSDGTLRQRARERGLSIRFLSDYEEERRSKGKMIFNYACLDTQRLPEALALLAELIRQDASPEGGEKRL